MKLLLLLALVAEVAVAEEFRVIVAGLGGEPDYETRFSSLAKEAQKLAGGDVLSGAGATKAELQSAIAKASRLSRDDTFTLLLIGHGTWDGVNYRFNLPGPDVTDEELRQWLDQVPAEQVLVAATSASGSLKETLKSDRRVVITATRSGTEKNAVVFSRYFVDALRDTTADSDKNEIVSAAEAFRYAEAKTKNYFETEKRLATEHAVMEDPRGGTLSGRIAMARFGSVQRALADPSKRALLARKEELERGIDRLKLEKAAMPVEEYKAKITALLVQLAQVSEEIEK
jgi:hypothetical protein